MKLPNSSLLKSTFASLNLNRLYNLKLPVFKFLGERTNHSENEQIYDPNFVWCIETSSSGDINPMSYHLTAFELTNQLLYMNSPSLERKIFQKNLTSTLPSSVALRFRNLGNLYRRRLQLVVIQDSVCDPSLRDQSLGLAFYGRCRVLTRQCPLFFFRDPVYQDTIFSRVLLQIFYFSFICVDGKLQDFIFTEC